MKFKIIFVTYITEYDMDAEQVANGIVWFENNILKIRVLEGDPYFAYNCISDSNIEDYVERYEKNNKTTPIRFYVSRTPELFVREPLEMSRLPPSYRFSSSPRLTAPDECGLESIRNINDPAIMADLDDLFDFNI